MQAELVLDARNAVGESPVWLASEQALYRVDIPRCRLYRWQEAYGPLSEWQAPEQLGCIAPHGAGGWLCAMESGVFHLRADSPGLLQGPLVAGVKHAMAGMRFNDGRCDRQGRFRAGTMVKDIATRRRALESRRPRPARAPGRRTDRAQRPIMMVNLGIGLITPPVGTVLFVGSAGARLSIERVVGSLYPFFLALCLVLMAVTCVPSLSLWLPGLLLAR